MKTVITIENGKITLELDDQQETTIQQSAPLFIDTRAEERKIEPLKQAVEKTKKCAICGDDFVPKIPRQKYCGKQECKQEQWRRNAAKKAKKDRGVDESVLWCKHCVAWTTHDTAGHVAIQGTPTPPGMEKVEPVRDFLPGHEKTEEEIKQWKHTVLPPANGMTTGSPIPGSSEAAEAIERVKNQKPKPLKERFN